MSEHFPAVTAERSKNMRSVKSRGNASTEQRCVRLIRRLRLSGWRRHLSLEGTPDFAWRKRHVAVFVDGCFWHGCPRCYRTPKTNRAYWKRKLRNNTLRDKRVTAKLQRSGWKVVRIWECTLDDARTAQRLLRAVTRS